MENSTTKDVASTEESHTQAPLSSTATEPDLPTTPILTLKKCIIRPYHASDAAALVHEANNPLVGRYMRNIFPSPYTLADAQEWIGIATARQPLRNFAVCHRDGTYAGGIGLKELGDVEARTMEIGYWLGERHWGQGIVSDAVAGFSPWAFRNFPDVRRLEAGVYEGNVASERVLLKAGYTREGARRKAGFKNGVAFDITIYGLLREDCKGL